MITFKPEEACCIVEACHGVLSPVPPAVTFGEILTGNVLLLINRYNGAERHGCDRAVLVSKLRNLTEEQSREVFNAALSFWRGDEGKTVLGDFSSLRSGLESVGAVEPEPVQDSKPPGKWPGGLSSSLLE